MRDVLDDGIGMSAAASARRRGKSAYDIRAIIDHLVSAGVLLPRMGNGGISSGGGGQASYWFTLPGMGKATALISEGRNRVLSRLRLARYREVRRSSIESGLVVVDKKAGGGLDDCRGIAGMTAAFHVRDLLSRGAVRTKYTPSGQFIKLL